MVTLVNHMKLAANWQPGLTFKSESHDNKKSDVTLSAAAMQNAAIFQHQANSEEALAATGFDSLVLKLHQQMLESGRHAEIFKEIPNDSDPARVALSQQATNYLLTSLYGEEKLHEGVSEENPFTKLDRLTLSNMAFDESGAFTSAERQVAFLEIAARDEEFIKQTYDLQVSLRTKDDTIHWGQITSFLRDAQLTSAMSEEERAWRGWPTAEELSARANFFMHQFGVEKLDLPAYENLKGQDDSALVIIDNNEDEAPVWKSIPIKSLDPVQKNISLVQAIVDAAISNNPMPGITEKQANQQVALYISINNYKSE